MMPNNEEVVPQISQINAEKRICEDLRYLRDNYCFFSTFSIASSEFISKRLCIVLKFTCACWVKYIIALLRAF